MNDSRQIRTSLKWTAPPVEALAGAALLAATVVCFGAVPAIDAVRDARAAGEAEEAWPKQQREVRSAIAAVGLPPRYVRVRCEHGVGDRCWRVQRRPSRLTAELASALSSAGVLDVEHQCVESLQARSEPAGCSVVGSVGERLVAITATRDLAPDGRSAADAFAPTSTVVLGADMSRP